MEAHVNGVTAPWRRIAGTAFGLGTQLLFLVTVWYLFWFLYGDGRASSPHFWLIDSLLALQFAVVHSWLLLPSVREGLKRWLPAELYGCLFCVATCLGLLVAFAFWHRSPVVLWNLQGPLGVAMQVAFGLSWAALLYSLSLTGLGYQTGLTQWLYWLRRQRLPRREFEPRGAYRWLRHPVYLSFLGLVWFTPRMTLDHALLTGLWTVYIFFGSYLKDQRLAHYLGERYRAYQRRVAGYPLLPWGPLGKLRTRPAAVTPVPAQGSSGRQAA